MLKFSGGDWAGEIADVTESPEYQTATIRIVDPSLVESEYNWDTGVWGTSGDGTVYSGQARIIGVRWGVFSGGGDQANPTTLSAVRVQLPRHAMGRVYRSFKVFIDSAPLNPALEGLMLTVTSDLQGASAATRTLELSLDSDYLASDRRRAGDDFTVTRNTPVTGSATFYREGAFVCIDVVYENTSGVDIEVPVEVVAVSDAVPEKFLPDEADTGNLSNGRGWSLGENGKLEVVSEVESPWLPGIVASGTIRVLAKGMGGDG